MEPTGPTVEVKQNGISRADFLCWLALVLVLAGAVVIRGRLLSIPLERDEGEYAYIAQQMLKGVPPYESAYSMKLPGIYAVYALFFVIFGQTLTAIHLGLLIANIAAILLVFVLTKALFDPLTGLFAAASFAILSVTAPVLLGLSANAEHFVLLPALVGLILLVRNDKRRNLAIVFIAALLFGLALVIKQHGIFFSIFAATYLLYSDFCLRPVRWKTLIITQCVFIFGAVAPFALICFFIWKAGAFENFWFWTFTYAGEYATKVPLSMAVKIFEVQFLPIVAISIPIWLFALAGLPIVVFRKKIRLRAPFVIGLLIFSFLSTCPGFYFRGHYFILMLPAVAVLAGAGFSSFTKLLAGPGKTPIRKLIMPFAGLVVVGFSLYQQRIYLFDSAPVAACRLIYGSNPFPESLEIAKYIKENSSPDDTVAVIGSEPQIYFYSDRRAATSYIYVYPLMETHPYALQMQKEMIGQIENAKPKFIVLVNVKLSWLSVPGSNNYIFEWINKYTLQNYVSVGLADIVAFDRTVYRWGRETAGYNPASKYWVAVYRRKQ